MESLARRSRRWASIRWADDLLVKPDRPNDDHVLAGLRLRARLDFTEPDQVWLCKLFDFPEKLVLESYPDATVHLFEDGLHSFVRQPVIAGRPASVGDGLASVGRWAARWTVGHGDPYWTPGEWAGHRARVVEVWRLTDVRDGDRTHRPAPGPGLDAPVVGIDHQSMRGVLDGLRAEAPVVDPAVPGAVLVLGQAFAKFDLMAEADEFEVYREACAGLAAAGHPVVWKDHPRLDDGFFSALERSLPPGAISRVDVPSALPIEVAIDQLDPFAVVSGTSTSLFTISALRGGQVFTFANRLRFPIHRRDHRGMAKLVARTFPDVKELPVAVPVS
jgi:hypothetical protein